jgi:UPF0755 protein
MPDHRRRRGSQPRRDDLLPPGYGAGEDEPIQESQPPEEQVEYARPSQGPTSDEPAYQDPAYQDHGYDDNAYEDQAPGQAGGIYISYVDEGELGADGAAILTAVFVDEHGYAADGSYIGPPVYVDEHGYADDGTFVALATDEPHTAEPGGGDDGRRRGLSSALPPDDPRRRRRWHRHPILWTFVAVVVVLVLIAGGTIVWAAHEVNPGGHAGRDVTVTIAKGETTDAIGKQLVKAGVIHGDGSLFRYYVKVEGDGPLYPGTYHLATNESYDHVISTLSSPPVPAVDTLVVPDGLTVNEIAQRVAALPGMHFTASAFEQLSSSGSVTSPYEPSGVHNLEGLLYPATYKFEQGTSESTVMSTLEGDFVSEANDLGLRAAAAKLHMRPYEVIIVASIIEGEAKFAADGPLVASVIYNRLKAGWTLGDDSTLVYALRKANPNININNINYNQPNPYNTRLHKGLPPTPINMPSTVFLKAAMHPANTSYMYFLEVDQDGKLGFATTSAQDNQLVATCKKHGLC